MLIRRFILALAAIAVLSAPAAVAPASAQPAASQNLPPDVRARMPAAREFVAVMRVSDLMKNVLPLIWQQLVSPLVSRDDPKIKAAMEAIGPMLLAEMTQELATFSEMMAEIYARNFTEEELRGLTVFMRGPIGQKFVGKQGELAQAGMVAGQQFAQVLLARMKPRIEEELRKRTGAR
jgi:hypothetical protein